MTGDPLEQVLRLVAEGRLTADEAAPILAALDERGQAGVGGRQAPPRQSPPGQSPPWQDPAGDPGAGPQPDAPPSGTDGFPEGRGASVLRIEVRDRGRQVVNLRLPIAAGRFALDRVPGLSGDQVTRVREALRSGATGTLLEVDDDAGGGVRIALE